MSDEPVVREHEPIERVRARLEALVRANAAPAAVLDPSGQASPAERQPCRTAGASFTAARARGPRTLEGSRAQQAGKLEARALFAGSQGGAVARAGGNACGPLSARLDLTSYLGLNGFIVLFSIIPRLCSKSRHRRQAGDIHPPPT
jgi:hypothetical protein